MHKNAQNAQNACIIHYLKNFKKNINVYKWNEWRNEKRRKQRIQHSKIIQDLQAKTQKNWTQTKNTSTVDWDKFDWMGHSSNQHSIKFILRMRIQFFDLDLSA